MKGRLHTFTIKLKFDRACGQAYALREAKACIFGNFCTAQTKDDDPGSLRVYRIERQRKPKKGGQR